MGENKVEMKGKHLQQIKNYVTTVAFEEQCWTDNEECSAVIETVTGTHPFLNSENARSILMGTCLDFWYANQEASGNLSEARNEGLRDELVKAITSTIESYPRRYSLKIELILHDQFPACALPITPNATLVIKPKAAPLTEIAKYFDNSRWLEAYMEFLDDGYATSYEASSTRHSLIAQAALCAFKLVNDGILTVAFGDPRRSARAVLTDLKGDSEADAQLSHSLIRCYSRLQINNAKLTVYKPGQNLLDQREVPAVTDEEKVESLGRYMKKLGRFLAQQDLEEFEQISTAIAWSIDSQFTDNQTFALMAACIGLEALIGSDEQIDEMSKRLGDRLAFMLGRNRLQRTNISKTYSSILSLRGKLVHGRKPRLTHNDRVLLFSAQDLLRSAINHELRTLPRQ